MTICFQKETLGIWYDYTCMPQKERTEAEYVLFKRKLDTLDDLLLLGNVYTLVLDEGDYSQRAWCVAEALIGGSSKPLVTYGKRGPKPDMFGNTGAPRLGAIDDTLTTIVNKLLQESGILPAINKIHAEKKWPSLIGYKPMANRARKAGDSAMKLWPDDEKVKNVLAVVNAQFDVKRLAKMVVGPLRVTNDGDKSFIEDIVARYLADAFTKPRHMVVNYNAFGEE